MPKPGSSTDMLRLDKQENYLTNHCKKKKKKEIADSDIHTLSAPDISA